MSTRCPVGHASETRQAGSSRRAPPMWFKGFAPPAAGCYYPSDESRLGAAVSRCIVGLRLTPVSTKAVDAAAVMYQVMRPKPACASWPSYAVWPEHGMPREVVIDPDQFDRTGKPAASPAINPESIVIDHGKIYVSQHLTSVCQRLGISIQPARIREGRDKGPLERFFRTVREGLLQYLPGYKGPDINARGLDVEDHA